MTVHNNSVKPGEIKANCHDPRHHIEFLQLSNNINAWKNHVHDRSWWLIQENFCLEIFQRHGYDLQSGVWFCLISCQRHGWSGVTNATLLLAEGFSKKQSPCWPPAAATDVRRQIIEWYCTHTATCVYGLSLNSVDVKTLSQFEGAILMLFEFSLEGQSRSQAVLRNLLDYLQANKRSLQQRIQSEKPSLNVLVSELHPGQKIQLKSSRSWMTLLCYGVTGMVLTLCAVSIIYWLAQPLTAMKLDQVWPDNPYSVYWKHRLVEQSTILPAVNSWVLVNSQLNELEQHLLDTEQKRRPYMTISELKTAIYNIRQTLQQGGEPVLAQLNDLQIKIDNQQDISNDEINAISQQIDALNSRLLQLMSAKYKIK